MNRPVEKLFIHSSVYLLSTSDVPGTLQRHLERVAVIMLVLGIKVRDLGACTELLA